MCPGRVLLTSLTAAALLALCVSLPRAASAAPPPTGKEGSFTWPYWQPGFETGVRAIGHFAGGSNLNTPPGAVYIHGQFHYWWQHLVEAHVHAGFGLTESSTYFGGGVKVNLFEFVWDPTGESIAKGLQRGALVNLLRNFMIFGGFDATIVNFPDPAPNLGLTYDTQSLLGTPMVGVQWYISFNSTWLRRFYIETALGVSFIGPASYLAPAVSFGFELR